MSFQDRLFTKVAEVFKVEKDSLTLESTFQELGADSLDMVELSIDVEQEFGVVVEQAHIASIKTLGDALKFIEGISK